MNKKKSNYFLKILVPLILFMTFTYVQYKQIPSDIYVNEKIPSKINNVLYLDEVTVPTISSGIDSKFEANVKLFGLIDVKKTTINYVKDLKVFPGGGPVGIKIKSDGVVVVSITDININGNKTTSPASEAGVMIGDYIKKINNKVVTDSEMLSYEINNNNNGSDLEFLIEREGKTFSKTVKPIQSSDDNKYKIGLWVRDSTAGIGTLTFYDNKTGAFGALGHAITDVDTLKIFSISEGEILGSNVVNIRKGLRGTPGELRGILSTDDKLMGTINKNTQCGIFGEANKNIMDNVQQKAIDVGFKEEITPGKAQIIVTLDETGPKYYDILIEKTISQTEPSSKSMLIKVTDPILLEKTGGIVQGMSGSPIIQNGKLVGAVTHVLVNKPDSGYGIYIEWMLKECGILK